LSPELNVRSPDGALAKAGTGRMKNNKMDDFFSLISADGQGCQICLGKRYQNGEKYTKLPQNISNCHKTYRKALK
jgi:uncharacterized protein YjlB